MTSAELTILIDALRAVASVDHVFTITLSQEAWDALSEFTDLGFVREQRPDGEVMMFMGTELVWDPEV